MEIVYDSTELHLLGPVYVLCACRGLFYLLFWNPARTLGARCINAMMVHNPRLSLLQRPIDGWV